MWVSRLSMTRVGTRSTVILIGSCCLVGCDPVRTTRQVVTLTVLAANSEEPVANAHVRLKEDFDRQTHTYPDTASREEWEAHARRNWAESPWFSAKSNDTGQTTLHVEYTALDRTRGDQPPTYRDWVTGKPFLVDITENEARSERLSVVMSSGNVIHGDTFTVRIDDVQAPVYIPSR